MSFAPRPKPKPKNETKELLDKMMDACNLPDAEKRRLRALGNGQRVAARGSAAPSRPRQYEDMLRGVALNPNIVTTRYTRTRAEVVASLGPGGYDRPQFGGAPRPRDNEAEKASLQMHMQFGKDAAGRSLAPAPPVAAPPAPRVSEEAALHQAISSEIDERRAFLDSMRAAGRAKEHEAVISAQIAERVQELKTVERLMKS